MRELNRHRNLPPFALGFTLMELMVTLALAATLVAIAIPNMQSFVQNNRVTTPANDLLRSMQSARSQAIRQQLNVVVCATANPTASSPTCTYGVGTATGWIVFVDRNGDWTPANDATEPILQRYGPLDSHVTMKTDNNAIISYSPSGFASASALESPWKNVTVCTGTNAGEMTRAILISTTGRPRVSKLPADISAATTATGGCP